MDFTAGIILFFVIILLVVVIRKRKVDSNTLQDLANFLTASSVIAAVIWALIAGIWYLIKPMRSNTLEPVLTPTINQPAESSVTETAFALVPTNTAELPTQTLLETPLPLVLQQISSTETGNNIRKTYEVSLYENEVIVGYGNKFENNYDCIAFIITGPGTYKFWLESGVWSKWTNVSVENQGQLLQKQVDTLSNYCDVANIKPIKIFASSMPSSESNSSSTLSPSCGEQAFDGNLKTSDPIFRNSNNYFFGWISSDKATIELPDGTTKILNTQFVLIAENIPYVQIKGVESSGGTANINGCWYPDNTFYEQIAKEEICRKKANNQNASYIKVTQAGFSELGTTTSITCP